MNIGYTTGTFDLFHEGHIRILKFMKLHCDVLIVGLTTDKLAIRQKNRCMFTYQHRLAILESCKYVDHVIPHNGASKHDAYNELHFNKLFIGDDYKNSDEYKSLENNKNIEVFYIPRTPNISTTEIICRLSTNWHVLNRGIHGLVLSNGCVVTKILHVGSKENNSTADVYNLPLPRPRNWKWEDESKYPNISGVNTNREAQIHMTLKQFSWNPVFFIHTDNIPYSCENDTTTMSKIQYMQNDRHNNTVKYITLYMKYCGETLYSWLTETKRNNSEVSMICKQIQTILQDLKNTSTVHGDIHPNNLCVYKNQVFLIDFGWCTNKNFEMNDLELKDHLERVDSDWDKKHLILSCDKLNINLPL